MIGVLLLLAGCSNPEREPSPDCTKDEDERCVLCVDSKGDADWYFTGRNWNGCPKGTILVRPYEGR